MKQNLWHTGSIYISRLDDDLMRDDERILEEYTGRLGRFYGVMNPAAGNRCGGDRQAYEAVEYKSDQVEGVFVGPNG